MMARGEGTLPVDPVEFPSKVVAVLFEEGVQAFRHGEAPGQLDHAGELLGTCAGGLPAFGAGKAGQVQDGVVEDGLLEV